MSSDELKVPSQRADHVEEEDERGRTPDQEGDEFPRSDLAAHERDDRTPGDTPGDTTGDTPGDTPGHTPGDDGSPVDDREAGYHDSLADDEFARSERPTEVLDGEVSPGERERSAEDLPQRQGNDDEYVAAVPGAVAATADDDAPYRDPYARTGGDMLADSRPDPAHTPAAADEVPAHAAPQDIFLFDQDPAEVQGRWRELQASFVDDPSESVQRADGLVSEVVESLTSTLTSRTSALRDRWKDAETSDTEELRLALRDYRSVLERLLALSSKSPHQFNHEGSR
ncbi:hypothetical protein [Nonomuraea rosea]